MTETKQDEIIYDDGITEEMREQLPFPIPIIDYKEIAREAAERDQEIYQPRREEQAKEFIENFDEVIDSEKAFLDLFNPDRYKFNAAYGPQGERKLFKLELIPVDDQDLDYIDMDLSIYEDLNTRERKVLDKFYESEKKLTRREQEIYDEIQRKEKKKQTREVNEMICTLLANHLTWPNHKDHTLEERIDFWKHMPFDFRTYLGNKALEILGLDNRNSVVFFRSDNTEH
jgi:hypothetical protein